MDYIPGNLLPMFIVQFSEEIGWVCVRACVNIDSTFFDQVTEDFETCYARAVRDYKRDLRLRGVQIGMRIL